MLGPRTKYVPNSMWPFAILHYGAISGEFKYSSISIILHAVWETTPPQRTTLSICSVQFIINKCLSILRLCLIWISMQLDPLQCTILLRIKSCLTQRCGWCVCIGLCKRSYVVSTFLHLILTLSHPGALLWRVKWQSGRCGRGKVQKERDVLVYGYNHTSYKCWASKQSPVLRLTCATLRLVHLLARGREGFCQTHPGWCLRLGHPL